MTNQQIKLQKQNLKKLKTIVRQYGADTQVSDMSDITVWLKKNGHPSLANLLSHDSKN